MKSIAIAMAAFNEADNIEAMILEVIRTMDNMAMDYEVIVVNDGSTDETANIVKSVIQKYPQVRLLEHEVNKGYGAAVFNALISARNELIFFTDSDRQFDLQEISKLINAIGDADLAIGYRSPRRDPFMRKVNAWGWNTLIRMLFGYTARDVDCAFKLMRREVVDYLRDKIKSRGATFSAEFLVRARGAGFLVKEVPVNGHRPRVAGSPTGARPNVILRAFKELILFRIALWKGAMPT
jgi:glycosyltransferase involved in cell wall biosynthesis